MFSVYQQELQSIVSAGCLATVDDHIPHGMQACTSSAPSHKKVRKGKVYIPRSHKLRSPEELLVDEQAAHADTQSKLDAVRARLHKKEQECSDCKTLLHTLQHQTTGLSAELLDKETKLQHLAGELSTARVVAATLDVTLAEVTASAVAHERSVQELLKRPAAQNLAVIAQQLATMQHALNELAQMKIAAGKQDSKIVSLEKQLQDRKDGMQGLYSAHEAVTSKLAAQQAAANVAASQVAALEQQLALLQHSYQAAQDDLAVQKAATFVAEAQINDLAIQLEYNSASLSQVQRALQSVSDDWALQTAATAAAEAKSTDLQLQLQDTITSLAQLQATNLVQQTTAAAAYATKVQELETLLHDATVKLVQMQLSKETSLDLLTEISADSIVSYAACEYVLSQQLEAATASTKALKTRLAVKEAEVRAHQWKLARAEATVKRMQQQLAQLQEQYAAATTAGIQSKVQLQSLVWCQTATLMQQEEAERAAQAAKQQHSLAQQKLDNAEEELLGWACTAAVGALTSCNLAGSTPAAAHQPTAALGSNAAHAVAANAAVAVEAVQPTSFAESSLPSDGQPTRPVAAGATACRSLSKPTALPNLYKSLNKAFKRLNIFCRGGFSKHSISSVTDLGEVVVHYDPVFDSFLAGTSQPVAVTRRMSIRGIAANSDSLSGTDNDSHPASADTVSNMIEGAQELSRWGSTTTGSEVTSGRVSSSTGNSNRASLSTDTSSTAVRATRGLEEGGSAAVVDDDVAADVHEVTAVIVADLFKVSKAGGSESMQAGQLLLTAADDVMAVA